ncbi:MAG: methyltransferase domain-containing protein [Gemmatimonadota bacterium]
MEDYYMVRLRSPAYRAARARKAALIYALCARPLAEARHVVDLGSGTGLVKSALEALTGRPIVGIEIDRVFLEEPSRTAVGDLLALPIRDRTIDFAIANHVYEHVADLDRFFAEVRRALAPGGRVYLTAGNRFALVEPHYRIPTLSWWPSRVATRLLRVTGRGKRYAGIRFRTWRGIVAAARRQRLALDDLTDPVLRGEIDRYESRPGRAAGRLALRVPERVRRPLLRWLSPQWFFLARRDDEEA